MAAERHRVESVRAFFNLHTMICRQPCKVLHTAAGPADFGACRGGVTDSEENLLGVLRAETCARLQDLHLPSLRSIEADDCAHRVPIALCPAQPEGQGVAETRCFAAQNTQLGR